MKRREFIQKSALAAAYTTFFGFIPAGPMLPPGPSCKTAFRAGAEHEINICMKKLNAAFREVYTEEVLKLSDLDGFLLSGFDE